jgi:hypothetical protein
LYQRVADGARGVRLADARQAEDQHVVSSVEKVAAGDLAPDLHGEWSG